MKRPENEAELKFHTDWCKVMFVTLNEGGVWAVPRSGLIFQKREGKLYLKLVAPWFPGMADEEGNMLEDADDLLLYQRNDYETVKWYFNEAGFEVDTDVDFDA